MTVISLSKPQFLSRVLIALLLIALGWQLAWWTWHFVTPALKSATRPTTSANGTDVSRGRQLFGDASLPPASVSTMTLSGIRLKGVFAVDGRTLSAAVLNLGGRDQAVKVSEELAPGVALAEVHADFVIISRAGLRERIEMDRFDSRAGKPVVAAGAVPPTQLRLSVASTGANAYSLSRRELNGVLEDPRQWAFTGRIVNAANGGVRVEDAPAGSLPDKLGIKSGDIITGINGQPVNSQGDLVRLYQQFATLTSIRAEVRRGGAPVMLSYTIQN